MQKLPIYMACSIITNSLPRTSGSVYAVACGVTYAVTGSAFNESMIYTTTGSEPYSLST